MECQNLLRQAVTTTASHTYLHIMYVALERVSYTMLTYHNPGAASREGPHSVKPAIILQDRRAC